MFSCPICKSKAIFFREILGSISFPKDKKKYRLYKCLKCDHIFRTNWLKSHIYTDDYYSYNLERSISSNLYTFIFKRYQIFPMNYLWSIIQMTTRYQNVPYITRSNVLDVGGGDGFALDLYKAAGNKTYNIEISDKIIELNSLKGHIAVKSSSEINGIKFDLIRVNQVVEHITDPLIFVEDLRRLLKPKGIMLVGIPNIRAMSFDLFGRNFDQLSFPDHHHFFSDRSIGLVFAKYKAARIEYPNHKYGPISNFVNILKSRNKLWWLSKVEIMVILLSLPVNLFLAKTKKSHFINIWVKK